MGAFFSQYKLILILAISVGSFLLYLIYLLLFTPNGVPIPMWP